MNDLSEKVLQSTKIFTGKFLKLRFDKVLLPNGKESTREIIDHPGAVAIVPLLPDKKVLLVKQFRYALNMVTLEIPAGKLEMGENPEACALRELQEETGMVAENLRKIAGFYTAPGFCNEFLHLYVTEGNTFVKQNLDSDEFIEIEAFTAEQIKEMFNNGIICDAKTLIGLSLLGFL